MFNKSLKAILLVTLLLLATVINAAQTVTYFHNDISGSPLMATDASGNVVWKENYYPYGERLKNQEGQQVASTNNKLWFTGKPHDEDTGLSYFGARYYNPILGRFMGIDPVDFNPDNIHSFNRYAYANNNPYRYVDPDGHSPLDIGFLVYDIGKAAVAIYSGQGVGMALADVAMSAIGVVSPIPGTGQALKAAKIVRSSQNWVGVASAAHKVDNATQFAKRGNDVLQTILHAKSKRGNFNIGNMTRSQMDDVGSAWVGANARPMMKGNEQIGWSSIDGLKTYRFPQLKNNGVAAGRTQGNLTEFVRMDNGKTQTLRNAHIDLLP